MRSGLKIVVRNVRKLNFRLHLRRPLLMVYQIHIGRNWSHYIDSVKRTFQECSVTAPVSVSFSWSHVAREVGNENLEERGSERERRKEEEEAGISRDLTLVLDSCGILCSFSLRKYTYVHGICLGRDCWRCRRRRVRTRTTISREGVCMPPPTTRTRVKAVTELGIRLYRNACAFPRVYTTRGSCPVVYTLWKRLDSCHLPSGRQDSMDVVIHAQRCGGMYFRWRIRESKNIGRNWRSRKN